ncbi:hypothetical protein GCM10017687_24090 [Streptomyces echinatus]
MQPAVHEPDPDEGLVVVEPDHRDVSEGGEIPQVGGPLGQQGMAEAARPVCRVGQTEDQQGDGDGEHTVAEGLGAAGVGAGEPAEPGVRHIAS